MNEWGPDQQPWIRQQVIENPSKRDTTIAQCYFCGEMTAKVSWGDMTADNGRVEVYCNNHNCEAREVVVLVERDSFAAGDRADVRALKAVDDASHSAMEPEIVVTSLADHIQRGDAHEAKLVGRRQNAAPISFAAWGPGELGPSEVSVEL
jgi:uncharacterized Zn finger protein